MQRSLITGQYYNNNSIIHRLDARVKLRFAILYIVIMMVDYNIQFYMMMTTTLILITAISRIKYSVLSKGILPAVVIIVLVSATNIFTYHGATVLNSTYGITLEGIEKAGYMGWRWMLIIWMYYMLMMTTQTAELLFSVKRCLRTGSYVSTLITVYLGYPGIIMSQYDRLSSIRHLRGCERGLKGAKGFQEKYNFIKDIIRNTRREALRRLRAIEVNEVDRLYYGAGYTTYDLIAYMMTLLIIVIGIVLIIRY